MKIYCTCPHHPSKNKVDQNFQTIGYWKVNCRTWLSNSWLYSPTADEVAEVNDNWLWQSDLGLGVVGGKMGEAVHQRRPKEVRQFFTMRCAQLLKIQQRLSLLPIIQIFTLFLGILLKIYFYIQILHKTSPPSIPPTTNIYHPLKTIYVKT